MKVFITGTESFIGKEFIRQCDKAGIEVTGVDQTDSCDNRFEKCDICDPEIVDYIPEKVDCVVHLAAISRDGDCTGNVYNCYNVNVMGTLNLVDAARQKGARQLVFASSEWVYGESPSDRTKDEDMVIDIASLISEYAITKLIGENVLRQMCQRSSFPITVLRFGIIYGDRHENWSAVESLFNKVATEQQIDVGSLQTGRHFVHVSDIAAAIINSIGLQGFEIINIQADNYVTLWEIIDTSMTILGKTVRVIEKQPKVPSIRRFSNAKAKKILGWQPAINIYSGLERLKTFLEYP